MLYLDN